MAVHRSRIARSRHGSQLHISRLQAVEEFSLHFSPITMEQDDHSLGTTKQDAVQGAPVLLVLNKVKPDWTPSIALTTALGYKQVKFLLTLNVNDGKTSSLFISFMPGSTHHGEADRHVLYLPLLKPLDL
jgi:hypothetical protein